MPPFCITMQPHNRLPVTYYFACSSVVGFRIRSAKIGLLAQPSMYPHVHAYLGLPTTIKHSTTSALSKSSPLEYQLSCSIPLILYAMRARISDVDIARFGLVGYYHPLHH